MFNNLILYFPDWLNSAYYSQYSIDKKHNVGPMILIFDFNTDYSYIV